MRSCREPTQETNVMRSASGPPFAMSRSRSRLVITLASSSYPNVEGTYGTEPVAITIAPAPISSPSDNLAWKFPTKPPIVSASTPRWTLTSLWLRSVIFAARRSWAFIPAGAISSNWFSNPPNLSDRSMRCVSKPWRANETAAVIPAIPPPITITLCASGNWDISSGSKRRAFSTAMETISIAFIVAASLSNLWTQESIFRMLDISRR